MGDWVFYGGHENSHKNSHENSHRKMQIKFSEKISQSILSQKAGESDKLLGASTSPVRV